MLYNLGCTGCGKTRRATSEAQPWDKETTETYADANIQQMNTQESSRFSPPLSLLADRPGSSRSSRLKRIVAIKSVSINEPFFQGHFPGFRSARRP